MTTNRREVLSGALALAVLVACRKEQPRPAASADQLPGMLFAQIGSDLASVDLASGKVAARFPRAVPDAAWQRLHWLGSDGRVQVADAASGRELLAAPSPGGEIKAVSAGQLKVAFGPGKGRRASTALTILGQQGAQPLSLRGTIEPEAFSGDGRIMYVLDHREAGYRVRMVHLSSGRMDPLLTRDKQTVPAEEEMRGHYRQAVLAPDRNVLYSLYTHQGEHLHTRDLVAARDSAPDVHAFVHVLHLNESWAYCLDLPKQMGRGPAAGHTLTLAPDGRRLFVFDSSSGLLVAADTEELRIESRRRLRVQPQAAYAHATADRLYLAVGKQVHTLAIEGLDPLAPWPLPEPARGVAALGREVLVGAGDQVLRLDARSGAQHGALRLPGLKEIRQVRAA